MPVAQSASMDRGKVTAAGILLAVVVAGSLVSPPNIPTPGLAGWDKLQHAAAYFALALAALYASDRDRWLAVAVCVAAVGAGVEVAQAFLPHRTASVADAVANTVGASVAVVGFYIYDTESGISED